MDPNIWGPSFWYILHTISFHYPEKPSEYQKRVFHDFFNSLKDVLPCDKCKKHYVKYVTEYPISPHLDKKTNLIKWLIDVHNFVNLSLNKNTMTYEEVGKLYNNMKPVNPFIQVIETQKDDIKLKKKEKNNNNLVCIILIFIIIIGISKYMYKKSYYDL
jgi:hypothetical protein